MVIVAVAVVLPVLPVLPPPPQPRTMDLVIEGKVGDDDDIRGGGGGDMHRYLSQSAAVNALALSSVFVVVVSSIRSPDAEGQG